MRVHPPEAAVVLLLFASIVSVMLMTRSRVDEGAPAWPDLRALLERLIAAEELGLKVNQDVSNLLTLLRNMTGAANATVPATESSSSVSKGSFLQVPSILHHLPHLRLHPHSLTPNIVLGQGRHGVSMVLGVPTVQRLKQSYLVSTITSLLFSLTAEQQSDLLIVVLVAETDGDYVTRVAETIMNNFPKQVQSGLLEVISPSPFYYPDWSNLSQTLGDPLDRVKWRTKQNLDFSFLMLYAQTKGTYYVQLEDDVIAKNGYYSDMKTFTKQEANNQWFYAEFSQLGFIGKMFRTKDLPLVVEFFIMFHKDKPIDWLLDHILWVKVCNPEKDHKDCMKRKESLKHRHKPSLFQHVGLHSSLAGKLQRLKDQDFGKEVLFQPHSNPEAELSSSLVHYQQHSLDRAYRGLDFFWAVTPSRHDYILFTFTQPMNISGFLFRSGNMKTSEDRFCNTTVEVLPSRRPTGPGPREVNSTHTEDFVVVGAFEEGLAQGKIDETLQPITALRLVVQSDAEVWAVLSEILIQVG